MSAYTCDFSGFLTRYKSSCCHIRAHTEKKTLLVYRMLCFIVFLQFFLVIFFRSLLPITSSNKSFILLLLKESNFIQKVKNNRLYFSLASRTGG